MGRGVAHGRHGDRGRRHRERRRPVRGQGSHEGRYRSARVLGGQVISRKARSRRGRPPNRGVMTQTKIKREEQ